MASLSGFEPEAFRLGGGCSIQLSYRDTQTSTCPLLAGVPGPAEVERSPGIMKVYNRRWGQVC